MPGIPNPPALSEPPDPCRPVISRMHHGHPAAVHQTPLPTAEFSPKSAAVTSVVSSDVSPKIVTGFVAGRLVGRKEGAVLTCQHRPPIQQQRQPGEPSHVTPGLRVPAHIRAASGRKVSDWDGHPISHDQSDRTGATPLAAATRHSALSGASRSSATNHAAGTTTL